MPRGRLGHRRAALSDLDEQPGAEPRVLMRLYPPMWMDTMVRALKAFEKEFPAAVIDQTEGKWWTLWSKPPVRVPPHTPESGT